MKRRYHSHELQLFTCKERKRNGYDDKISFNIAKALPANNTTNLWVHSGRERFNHIYAPHWFDHFNADDTVIKTHRDISLQLLRMCHPLKVRLFNYSRIPKTKEEELSAIEAGKGCARTHFLTDLYNDA